MTFSEYRQHDALGLAHLVKTGQTTPAELLDLAIQRCEEQNPAINAVIHKMYDQARAALADVSPDAPFAGVPFLVKDLGVEIAGEPLRTGCQGWEGYVSPRDSYAVTRMRRAGLVIFGKTNTPEFGLTPYTEPKRWGPTRNPHNLAHSSGGSSGGSAASVAAGIVPMATANDGGGSIRIPATCCGLFGLKPSRGRVSWGPVFGEMWNGAAVEGCVSRSVRDSAAYLDVLQGLEPGDPYGMPTPARPYLQEVGADPGKLRIGYTCETPGKTPVDPACVEALMLMVKHLRDLGHVVEEVPSPYELADLTEAFLRIVASETAGELRLLRQHLGRAVRLSDVESNTYGLAVLGEHLSGGEYAFARKRWSLLCQRMADFHTRHDLLLTPTLGARPIQVGALQNSAVEEVLVRLVSTFRLGWAMRQAVGPLAKKIYGYMPWTAFANMTGEPSMSIPTLRTAEEGLPIGTMFTAALGREDQLFRLAAQLEQHAPWDKLG